VTLSRDVIFSYSPTVPASPNPLFRPSRTGRDVAVPWPAKSIVQSDTTCTVYAVPHYDHTTPLTGEFASALFSSSASPGTVTGDGIQFNSINSSTSHFRTLHQFSSFPTLHTYQETRLTHPLVVHSQLPAGNLFRSRPGRTFGRLGTETETLTRSHTYTPVCISPPRPSYQPDRTLSSTPRSPAYHFVRVYCPRQRRDWGGDAVLPFCSAGDPE
jgi:hypothetical protein